VLPAAQTVPAEGDVISGSHTSRGAAFTAATQATTTARKVDLENIVGNALKSEENDD
jgi:hypothetical protein